MSAVILGPWGGSGGDAFDDGWNNGGVSKLTIYYQPTIVRGVEVAYGNGTTKLHGRAVGTTQQIDLTSSISALDISVTVGRNSDFSGDPNNLGVVAIGAASSSAPPSVPSGRTGQVFRPRVVGFFGSSGTNIDRLGIYLSDSIKLRTNQGPSA